MEKRTFLIPELQLFSEAQQENISKFCIGAGIIREDKILLVRRSPEDFLGGFYEIPGGGVDTGESLEATLHREVLEETGLVIVGILGMFEGFDYFSESGKKTRQFNFAVTVEAGEVTLAPTEHDQHIWVNDRDIDEIDLSPEMKKAVKSFFSKYV